MLALKPHYGCRLRPGAVCSDRNSLCCRQCQLREGGAICREDMRTTCQQRAACTGGAATCPAAQPMKDGTPCAQRGRCEGGRCLAFCETLGQQSCMCDTREWNLRAEIWEYCPKGESWEPLGGSPEPPQLGPEIGGSGGSHRVASP